MRGNEGRATHQRCLGIALRGLLVSRGHGTSTAAGVGCSGRAVAPAASSNAGAGAAAAAFSNVGVTCGPCGASGEAPTRGASAAVLPSPSACSAVGEFAESAGVTASADATSSADATMSGANGAFASRGVTSAGAAFRATTGGIGATGSGFCPDGNGGPSRIAAARRVPACVPEAAIRREARC